MENQEKHKNKSFKELEEEFIRQADNWKRVVVFLILVRYN